ncbi:MAG TPA: hypothetical protein DEB40_01535 [Elusimicrobia bacterium]|nr:hypothetical protein [Elusimicrobiota bacterium]HBT60411.1 hypothetical protein [Elusimicrobiota bacterium]
MTQVEILPRQREPKVHVAGAHVPGWFGAILALLTMAAAFGVGFLALFGRTLVAALLVRLLWPLLFSAEFTRWVFGAERVVFWKVLVLFLGVDVIARLFVRRELWPRK